jgi:hypothetical protein
MTMLQKFQMKITETFISVKFFNASHVNLG